MPDINNSTRQIRLPLLLALTLAGGIFIGTAFTGSRPIVPGASKGVVKFREVLSSIDENYVDSVNTNALVDIAIRNMLQELDPHTAYISAKELELSNMHLKGGYDGIGVQFDIIRDTIVVVKAIAGGPSERAGVRAGDKIIKVNDEVVAGIAIGNKGVTDRLLGEKGSQVTITVIHYGASELQEITITRGKIPQKTVVAAYMAAPETGYIKLVSFGANSYDEFKEALEKLLDQGMQRLIFDLQGNGGGYMAAAERIADELIGGDRVIVSQKGKTPKYTSVVKAKRQGIFEEQPVIVLIDEYSASASEIVAGALQDNDRALIVGRRSYGKGLVQMPIRLIDGSELRLTIARYYTPSGRSIQKPYVKGENASYAHDLVQRYEHGEFYYQDSIHFNDSLKYTTPKGRVVYGGGGIMPDKFVPYDSTLNTDYYNALITSRTLREFTLTYYLQHRQELEDYTLEEYIAQFKVDQLLAQVRALGERQGVTFREEDFRESKKHIMAYIKAEIARSVWDDAGFYPVYNAVSNPGYIEALNLGDEAQALAGTY